MKIHKRILSFLTSAVMSLTMTVSMLPANAEEGSDLTTDTTKDVQYTAESSLGALLLDETQTAQEDAFDGSCGITDVTVENGTASVSYYVNTACELVVGFYSDDESQMYASVSEHVTPPEENTGGNALAEFTLPDEVPEYYLVKAFLVAEDLSPLCTAYSTNLYTEEITRIRNATAADYDADLVVQLDEKTDTNFMVLSDSTVQIPYNGTSNLLSSYDEQTGVYTFTAIDSSISSLKAGDVVYYDYDGQQLVFTVASITIDGTSAVIASGDMELTDAFSLVKIEETLQAEVEDPDATDMGMGLTYTGVEQTPAVKSKAGNDSELGWAEVGMGFTYKWEKTLMEADPLDVGVFEGTADVSVNLSFTVRVPLRVTLYQSNTGKYAKTDIGYSVKISGNIEGNISGTLYFKRMQASLFGLIGYDVGIGFNAELSGKIEVSATLSQNITFYLGHYSGKMVECEQPQVEFEAKPEVEFFAGIVFEAKANVGKAKYDLSAKAGVDVKVTFPPAHRCAFCAAGKVNLVANVTFKYPEKFKLLGGSGTVSVKPLDLKFHLFDFYYSTYCGFGMGNCPYRTDIDHSSPSVSVENAPISIGTAHSAAITEDGSLYMWGRNSSGEYGNGTTESSSVPVRIMGNVKAVSHGAGHSAAITEDGSLYTWGANDQGQLGNGTTEDSFVPVKIMDKVKAVSLGIYHSAAITEDGSLYMWGDNWYRQLGNGTTEDSSVPVKIMDNVKAVSLGYYHSAAITEDGSLYMWGDNSKGQLGNGTTKHSSVPVKIMDNVKTVSLGANHSAAITEDGSLYMWGWNYEGQLGNGTEADSSVPVRIMDNVKAVSLGYCHSAAITEDGSLYMWGYNKYGQLGNGTTEPSSVPVKIMDNVKAVGLGDHHSAVITEDGSLYTWGENNCGQLGNGTTENSLVPVKIPLPAPVATKSLPPAPKPLAAAPVRTLNAAAAAPQSAELTGLTPGMVYNVYCMADPQAENPLGSENLLYINQYTADENGTISAQFTPTREVPGAQTIACAPETGEFGDVDGNGQIELLDVVTLNKNLLGLVSLDTRARRLADVDQNDLVDGSDSLYILRFLVSLIESLPVQQ